MSFASVVFLSHSHLSSSLGILNRSFPILCHCMLSLPCAILLSCAFAILCLMCSFLIYVKLLLSFCSVMFFCRSSAMFLVSFLCHCLLSCCSVLFSAIFFWSIHLAFCSCHFQSCFALDIFWYGRGRTCVRKEGVRRMRVRRRRRRSGLHTNSNNPILKGGEKPSKRHQAKDANECCQTILVRDTLV